MFNFTQYMNLQNGTVNTGHTYVHEKATDDQVKLIFIDALSGSIGDMKRTLAITENNGVCIRLTPTRKIIRYMADYKKSEFWCEPFFGTDISSIPDETQLLVLELEDGQFCTIVPVVNDKYRWVLRGIENANTTYLEAAASSWCDNLYTCSGLAFAYAVGDNPNDLIRRCVKAALKELNNGIRPIDQRRYPELMEYLGWCSWDSMQIRVDENGILEKCEEFKTKEIPVKWAIIDDMWAHIRDFYGKSYETRPEMFHLMHSSSLYHFEADPKRFPDGLASCVEKIKEYGISVGMWHPTTGYWRGIDPEGPAYLILKDFLMHTDQGYWIADWHKEKSYLYYKTIHDFFRKCGVDFVKIDNQSMINRYYRNQAPVGKVAREYHDGMEASVGEHFDNCMINCMGCSSEDIWSRTVSPITRCSDDFQPEAPQWFTKHMLQCAYNSLLLGQFYWCDWDMWWTDDSQGPKNSLMRAVSGGPVYVSDMIGRSRKELFEPLALSDGNLLRCDRPAMPTADCITRNPAAEPISLKIQNMAGEHGVMAVLNITNDNIPVTTTINSRQIDGFEAEEYVVYDYFAKNIMILKKEDSFEITLENKDTYKLYIFAPYKNGFAAIGRTDKFICPKTIEYVHKQEIVLKEDGPYAYVKDGKLILK